MDNLEKLIFLEITNKQFTKFHNSEYYNTLKLLSETEQNEFYKLADEIHLIWNNLNAPPNLTMSKIYNSFDEYKNEIPVSRKITKIMDHFDLDLKNKMSDEIKKSIIKLLGKDFFDRTLGQ